MATLLAPAKINLTLEILSRRADGYHELRSLMVPIGLFDRISLDAAEASSFESNIPGLDQDNLVVRALRGAGVEAPLRVQLEKRVPIGGGLGGGSSDAAAVLRAVKEGTLGSVPAREWVGLARTLGSDVPFFLVGTGAVIEGTGEVLTPARHLPAWWVVIVRPTVAVATADAYRRLAASRPNGAPLRPREASPTFAALDALERADFAALERLLVNDFHELIVASYPLVAAAHASMVAAGARRAMLSGSGSCLFAIFEGERAAREIACKIAPDDAVAEVFVAPLVSEGGYR